MTTRVFVPIHSLRRNMDRTACFTVVVLACLCLVVERVSSVSESSILEDPLVYTSYGLVRGQAVTMTGGRVINTYMGIPYAQPPVGDLRFKPPVRPNFWTYRDAVEPRAACVQVSHDQITKTHKNWDKFSEDCLFLNIYSPKTEEDNLPVLVYIHGGAFQEGTSFGHPGYILAERGVVVVTIDYRLGVLGFAFTKDGAIPGNIAIRDQILALKFVQENIGKFGGNPNKVTIAGRSSGGASAGILMMSPEAKGLFHRAIPQSGNELGYWAVIKPEMEPEQYIVEVAEKLNCPTGSSTAMVDCLRDVPALKLMNTTFTCPVEPEFICKGFLPVVDGDILPDKPRTLLQKGTYNKVPEMIGKTEDEMNFYLVKYYPTLNATGMSRADFDDIIELFIDFQLQQNPDVDRSKYNDLYEAVRFYYADWPYLNDPFSNRHMLGKLVTDQTYGISADDQAKLHCAGGQDVYYYIYDFKVSLSPNPDWMGSVHTDDNWPEFGWAFMADHPEALRHSLAEPLFNINGFTEMDKKFTAFYITLWTNFVKYGNPTPSPVLNPSGNVFQWSKLTEDDLYYAHLSVDAQTKKDYRQKDYAFWNYYFKGIMNGNGE